MAGHAILGWNGIALVGFLEAADFVARSAQGPDRLPEPLRLPSRVRHMAAETCADGRGPMGMLGAQGGANALVAGQAELHGFLAQQPFFFGSMRAMAFPALAVQEGFVPPVLRGGGCVLVAGKADLAPRGLQKRRMPGGMGFMAGEAFSRLEGPVLLDGHVGSLGRMALGAEFGHGSSEPHGTL